MATSKAQRVGIWVIAGAMAIGTIAGFVAMMLAPANEQADQKKAQEEYMKQYAEYQKQQSEANAKASQPLDGYSAAAFDAKGISTVQAEVLKQGEGETLEVGKKFTANYFGWTADGKIFDSSKKNGTTTPASFDQGLDGVIAGWKDGLTGVKMGSVIKLTIPADKAYGAEDKGTGDPVGPLQFIVELKEITK